MPISPRIGTSELQRFAFLKYDNTLKGENSLYGRMLSKLLIITKNASNKSCPEFNFLQRSRQVVLEKRTKDSDNIDIG